MKILVGVIASELPEYQTIIREGQRRTWADPSTVKNSGDEVVFYYGGRDATTIAGDEVYFPIPEGFDYIMKKTIAFFRLALRTRDFNYLFRTNCSSYVNLANLKKNLQDAPRRGYFSSVTGFVHPDKRRSASGSGYALSRDLVELVMRNQERVDRFGCPDDVMLSFLLEDLGYPFREGRRQDFTSLAGVKHIDPSHYHYRCKVYRDGKRIDHELMRAIHEKLTVTQT